jgi:hypothetical protein
MGVRLGTPYCQTGLSLSTTMQCYMIVVKTAFSEGPLSRERGTWLKRKVIARPSAEGVANPKAGARDVGGWDSTIWDSDEEEAKGLT